jgi:4-hydroxybenzoate polyprenyltransferase
MTDDSSEHAGPTSRVRAYLELVRLPNIFTALADVTMGFLFTHAEFGPRDGWVLGLLLAASASLYAAGVVLNDVFDREVDARERPERPIPSGRVSAAAAGRLGWGLLVVGASLACGASVVATAWRPAIVGLTLAGCIVLYDGLLKRTPLGPIAMGACRTLNVLLGMSVLPTGWAREHWLVAAAVGTYIAGVTLLATSEARQSSRWQLALATVVILAGIGLLVPLPSVVEEPIPTLIAEPYRWYLLLGVLGAFTGLRLLQVVFEPFPDQVQVTVKHCILSLVIFDAAACYVVRDVGEAAILLLFLLPAAMLGRWLYST